MAAAQARRKGLMRRAGDMRYSLLQCCHVDAPVGRTQRGDGGQSPPLPGRSCRLAFGVRELPLSGAVAGSWTFGVRFVLSSRSLPWAGCPGTTNIRTDPCQGPDLVLKLCTSCR